MGQSIVFISLKLIGFSSDTLLATTANDLTLSNEEASELLSFSSKNVQVSTNDNTSVSPFTPLNATTVNFKRFKKTQHCATIAPIHPPPLLIPSYYPAAALPPPSSICRVPAPLPSPRPPPSAYSSSISTAPPPDLAATDQTLTQPRKMLGNPWKLRK